MAREIVKGLSPRSEAQPPAPTLEEEIDTSQWPDSLLRLAAVIGPDAALKLVDHFGGTRANYVARRASPNHPWAQLIGFEAYQALCSEYGGTQIDIPRFHFRQLKKAVIIQLWETTELSKRQIALRTRTTEGYVQTVCNQLREARGSGPRQLDLFGERNGKS